LPAREGMVGLSRDGFGTMDAVLARGRPAARWVRLNKERWRLIVAPRIELGTGEVYGVAFHLAREEGEAGVAGDDWTATAEGESGDGSTDR
jgi:hypothetical protein